MNVRSSKERARETQHGFEALVIEGGLLSPEWLSKVAQLAAGNQAKADYRIPKRLNLRDEIGRFWRIAQAHWRDFSSGLASNVDRRALSERSLACLLRESFGFTSLARVEAPVLSGRRYPIGHAAMGLRVPVVIAPAGSGMDTVSPTFGDEGRRRSAFGLAQEYLNAARDAVWGIATDGSTLRILRDNASLTRPAWFEADLARIFTEERYADFAALWLLLHESRFGREGHPANECALESWREAGRKEGSRAREHLRKGVEEALVALGQGFLSHPENRALRMALEHGSLSTRDYFGQLLRLVYRLIFLLTVEERNLLHPDGTSDAVRALYSGGYALRRLCDRSVRRSAHDRFSDLWDSAMVILRGLANGEPRLGLPALAGIFARDQCPLLDAARLENRDFLLALFKLAWLPQDDAVARVNWREMGPEELGSVYESLLELVPRADMERRQFGFATGDETKGNARKTTGSYYTPDSLVQVLLDGALEPVIADRMRDAERMANGEWSMAEEPFRTLFIEHARQRSSRPGGLAAGAIPRPSDHAACLEPHALQQAWRDTPFAIRHSLFARELLLRISIVDPACGSGHFLLAAARRLAAHVARLEAHGTPSAAEYRHALREVVGKCIHGVDLNPMAVELCKVSLWMEAMEPGLPLTFLNSHVQHGNALLGATPELMAMGIPDAAWKPIADDDPKLASALRRRNKQEAAGHRGFDMPFPMPARAAAMAVTRAVHELEDASDSDAAELALKEARWNGIITSADFRQQKLVADAWCAAFVWPKQAGSHVEVAPTNDVWRRLRRGAGQIPERTRQTVEDLARQHRFFHWHLQFPQVFAKGGFDVVLGNPPFVNAIEGSTDARAKHFYMAAFDQLTGTADLAYFFVSLSHSIASRNGMVGMIQPKGFLNSDSATQLRSRLLRERSPTKLHVPLTGRFFGGAATYVCIICLGHGCPCAVSDSDRPDAAEWKVGSVQDANWWLAAQRILGHATEASAIDRVSLEEHFDVVASMTTSEAYEARRFIHDDERNGAPRLITTGLIDPNVCDWGRTPCRYLGAHYQHPTVVPGEGMPRTLARRMHDARRKKVLVAGLSKQVEAFLDLDANCIGAVSTFSVFHPADDGDALSRLCNWLNSDEATAMVRSELGAASVGGGYMTLKKGTLQKLKVPKSIL